MKFLSNIFLGGLLLTASTVAFASPRVGEKKVSRVSDNRTGVTFETSAFVTKDAAIRLAVKKNAPERVYITLRDAKNVILYRETITQNEMSYAAKINVNYLSDGNYKLEIATNQDRVVKHLHLTSPKSETERVISVN